MLAQHLAGDVQGVLRQGDGFVEFPTPRKDHGQRPFAVGGQPVALAHDLAPHGQRFAMVSLGLLVPAALIESEAQIVGGGCEPRSRPTG